LDHISSALIAENLGRCASFATTCCAQTGIGLWPIIHFGTETAKLNYLPRIASGELITAYSLTEATSGSDALAARATARLSADGTHYILNGEKAFVTNGGLADIFIVFAKIDGSKFTAFIVEAQEGVNRGVEERKMGIRGSSTTSLVLTDAKVSAREPAWRSGDGPQDRLRHS
jgi:alkylation response protein AidB-like acyl-CoA dehydrogenase